MPEAEAATPEATPEAAPQAQDAVQTETAQDAINEVAEAAKQQAAIKNEVGEPETDKDEPKAEADDPDDAPITDWSSIDLGLPEDAAIDQDMLASFGELAVEQGINKKLASALANWQVAQIAERQKAYEAEQKEMLAKAWGKKSEAKSKAVINYLQSFGDEVCAMLKAAGAHENAAFLIFAEQAASRAAEDSLNSGSQSGGGVKPETALEGINAVFAETNGGRSWDGK